MKAQLQSCLRFCVVLAVLSPFLFAGGGCGGNGGEQPPFWLRPPANFYGAKVLQMTLPETVRQGESPIIEAKLRMTKTMASLLPENGYAMLVQTEPVEFPAPPGQTLLFLVSVYYSRLTDESKDIEVDALFPGYFHAPTGDELHYRSSDPFAKNLAPGRYNVYARVPSDLPEDLFGFFGSFEVLPTES
ncbi:MAG: hypothetical protein HRF49_07445 [bacterium]|jgi:hypothetical protein